MTHAEGFKKQGDYKPCNLLAGEYPRVERIVTIKSGQNVKKGSVLGKITSSGKFVLSLKASSDGSETPDAILAEAVDASTADKHGVVYFSGEFNQTALVFGTGHTAANTSSGLRQKSIFLRKNQPV